MSHAQYTWSSFALFSEKNMQPKFFGHPGKTYGKSGSFTPPMTCDFVFIYILGLDGVMVPIIFGNEPYGSVLPYSKEFIKFGCPEPSKKCLPLETFCSSFMKFWYF